MRHQRLLVVVLLTFVLSMQASTSRATTAPRDFGASAHPFLMSPSSPAAVSATAPAAPQDPTGVEVSLDLDRFTRRLIQQGLRNEGFDPGTADGLFGPRTRGAIRDWQRSRGASPTGYLNRAEAERLRAAAAPPPAVPGASPPLESVSPSASLAPPAPASRTADTNAARTPAATEVDPQSASRTNTDPRSAPAARNLELPPEILVDRHLIRAERLLAADPAAALEAMNQILTLRDEHGLVLEDAFRFQYAEAAFAAGRTETAIASLNEYLVAAGRAGEFYREALELLDSAEVRFRREEAERRRADVERRRATRWPPGQVFRDCEACPEMVVMPGSRLALGRYEVTVGEYRAFASTTDGGAGGGCETFWDRGDSWRNPGYAQTDRHPVTCMSWRDAQAYVSWLSRTSGAPYRLPTWAELVRASDGSPSGCYFRDFVASDGAACPVGTHGPSGLGVSDMLGNVAEWASDCWDGDCRRAARAHGGSWGQPANWDSGLPQPFDRRLDIFGLRVARRLE